MDRISVPLLPCASRERRTCLDIMKKKSVRNCMCCECLYRGASHSPLCYLEVKHIAIDFDHIYLAVSITNTIRSFIHSIIIDQVTYKGLIITTLTGKVIQTLIILNPESNIPGLVIRPTVIESVGQIGLESGSHLWKKVLVSGKRFQSTEPSSPQF